MSEAQHIVFQPGMREDFDPRTAPPGTLTLAQNVRFRRTGRAESRDGTAILGSPRTGSGHWVADTIAGPLFSAGGIVQRHDGSLFSDFAVESPITPRWREPVYVTALDSTNPTQPRCQCCAFLGTRTVFAWQSFSTVFLAALDEQGRRVWSSSFNGVSGGQVRLVPEADGNGVRVVYLSAATTVSTRLITYGGSGFSVSAATNLVTLFDATSDFDVAPYLSAGTSGPWLLAYRDGATSITVKTYTGTSATATVSFATGATPSGIAVAGEHGATNAIVVAWHEVVTGSDVVRWTSYNEALSLVLTGPQTVLSGPPTTNVVWQTQATIRYRATTGDVYFAAGWRAAATSDNTPQIGTELRRRNVAGGGSSVLDVPGWLPAGKWLVNVAAAADGSGVLYLPTQSRETLDGPVVGQRAYRHGILASSGELAALAYEREPYAPGFGPSIHCLLPEVASDAVSGRFVAALLCAAGDTAIAIDALGGQFGVGVTGHRGKARTALSAVAAYVNGGLLQEASATGAVVGVADGGALAPNNFPLIPVAPTATFGAGGNLTNGTLYSWRVVYQEFDDWGQRVRSEPSVPATGTPGSPTRKATLQIASIHGRKNVRAHVYRSWAGGPYYRVSDTNGVNLQDGGFVWASFDDVLSDAAAQLNEILYTDGALPNAPPSGAKVIAIGGGRMLSVGWDGRAAWVTKLFVAGEPYQFVDDDAFRLRLPERITAAAFVDGSWVLFTAEGIYLTSGDGPTDDGQTPFPEPARLAVSSGCVDGRSLLVTERGILYRSALGIMLLPRGFGPPVFIGEPVHETVDDNPVTLGAALVNNADGELAYFVVCANEDSSSPPPVVLVLDLGNATWSLDAIAGGQENIHSCGVWDDRFAWTVGLTVLTTKGALRVLDPSSAQDHHPSDAVSGGNVWIERRLELAELRPFGENGWGELERLVLLGEPVGACKVNVRAENDAVSYDDVDVDAVEWALAAGSSAFYRELVMGQRQGTAFLVKIWDEPADAAAPVMTLGVALHALSIEGTAEEGLRRTATEERG